MIMTRPKVFISISSLFLVLFICCTKNSLESPPFNATCSTSIIKGDNDSNVVSGLDLLRRLNDGGVNLKSHPNDSYSLSVYTDANVDTLLFIVNFKNGGWKIYSSDKRTPPIIAEGEQGYFSLEDGSPAVNFWLGRMAEDIAMVRRSSDDELSFSAEEIKTNREFWSGKEPTILLDVKEEPILRDPPPGHWEVDSYTVTEVYDSLPHMVAQWSQWEPYNEYSPYYVNSTERACAGCVAVAGAQVLHYLNYKIGLPSEANSMGLCVGDINNFSRLFWSPTSSIWALMDPTSHAGESIGGAESLLLGNVGALVNMHYCHISIPLLDVDKKFSWAIPANLKTDVFEPMGINCSHGDYSEFLVRENLSNQLPVIVSASDLLIPADGDIHCFVIDGYKRKRTKYCYHHYYVLDEPPSPYQLYDIPPQEYTTYSYGPPIISQIKINWGWWTQWDDTPVNDGWYSLTSGWTATNNGTYNYNHNIKIICNFAADE